MSGEEPAGLCPIHREFARPHSTHRISCTPCLVNKDKPYGFIGYVCKVLCDIINIINKSCLRSTAIKLFIETASNPDKDWRTCDRVID